MYKKLKLLSLIFATAQRREAKCAVTECVQATGRTQSCVASLTDSARMQQDELKKHFRNMETL